MSLHPSQVRGFLEHSIVPALEALSAYREAMDSPAAQQLVLTAAVAEGGPHFPAVRQIGGPALGAFQMEPATHDDLWGNYLLHRPALAHAARDWAWARTGVPDATEMAWNARYAAAMARLQFWRRPEPLPPGGDPAAMAAYYKRFYNTAAGAADSEHVAALFAAHVWPLFAEALPLSEDMPLSFSAGAGPAGYSRLKDRMGAGMGPTILMRRTERQTARLTAEIVGTLVAAQAAINDQVRYVPDSPGTDDWREALTRGDCEDIAIAVLVKLLSEGFPAPGALRLAVCKTAAGVAHAVLTVFTDRGVFVLDNLRAGLWPWRECGHDWIAVEVPDTGTWQLIADG